MESIENKDNPTLKDILPLLKFIFDYQTELDHLWKNVARPWDFYFFEKQWRYWDIRTVEKREKKDRK